MRVLEQYWKLGTCSVREILESLPSDVLAAVALYLNEQTKPTKGNDNDRYPYSTK